MARRLARQNHTTALTYLKNSSGIEPLSSKQSQEQFAHIAKFMLDMVTVRWFTINCPKTCFVARSSEKVADAVLAA